MFITGTSSPRRLIPAHCSKISRSSRDGTSMLILSISYKDISNGCGRQGNIDIDKQSQINGNRGVRKRLSDLAETREWQPDYIRKLFEFRHEMNVFTNRNTRRKS